MKLIVIGGRKCGSTSTANWLKEKGNDVVRIEQLFTRTDGRMEYDMRCPDRKPVIVLRNPIDRAWSDYNYAKKFKRIRHNMTLEEYGNLKLYVTKPFNFGDLNILSQSDYSKWYDNWKDLDPIIYWLEDLKMEEDFPWFTRGDWPEMTANELIYLQQNIIDSGNNLNELLSHCKNSTVKNFYNTFIKNSK